MFQTAVGTSEMLTEIHIPANTTGSAYEKFSHPASRYAIVGVAVVKYSDGSIKAAVTGAGANAMRLSKLEGGASSGLVSAEDLLSDHFASAEYRAHLVDVLAKKAVARA
jgi:aerobic carbon-monoxide dehydrogenase medium subunit